MPSIRSSIWPFVGLDDHLGIDQPGRPDDLLDDLVGHAQLVRARRGRQEHRLVDPLEHLVERERPVVARRRQAEAVLDEHVLAAAVALELAVQLRHRDVALVDDEQEVVGEVVEQRERRLAERCDRRCASSSSRCRCSSRPRPSSRGRTRCASGGAAPRAACPPSRTTPAVPAARPRSCAIACAIRSSPAT